MDRDDRGRSVEYATELFARESEAQRWVRRELEARGLPLIQVSPLEGRLLAVLARSVDARRVLEVGTLGGYSALWLVSLLPPDARLLTLERVPEHAELAREAVRRAGEEGRIEVREGEAGEALAALVGDPPFDFVFIDADKEGYPRYLEEAARLLRPGGIVAVDNALWKGKAARPPEEDDASTRGVRELNRMMAEDPRFQGVIVPIRDGLAVARFRG